MCLWMHLMLVNTTLPLLLHQFCQTTSWVSRHQKGKTSLDSIEARDDGVLGWRCHQLYAMQTICTSLQRDNHTKARTHTHSFNGPFSGTTWVSRYQKGKTNLDFTEARDSKWQWHQLGYVQVCTSLQTDNHASTPPLSFSQAGCPSCRPTYSVKALKALWCCVDSNHYAVGWAA